MNITKTKNANTKAVAITVTQRGQVLIGGTQVI